MTARQQLGVVAGVIMVLAIALFAATHYLGNELFPVVVGSKAPQFKVVTLDSVPRTRTLDDFNGKVVLLNVWATWCGPCRQEMPSLERLQHDFGPQGLKIVAVSVDDPGTNAAVQAYAKQLGLTFEILFDPQRTITAQYQITAFPETFIIGQEGTIRRKVIGAADWNSPTNRALIRELLGDAATASR